MFLGMVGLPLSVQFFAENAVVVLFREKPVAMFITFQMELVADDRFVLFQNVVGALLVLARTFWSL